MNPEEWLKDQCNRYANGECHTTNCLNRGHWNHGVFPIDYSFATCHAHETLKLIAKLEGEINGLQDNIRQLEQK